MELTGHRAAWYHKEPRDDKDIFYTLTMAYDLRNGHIIFMHANTEDKKGDAYFTADFILKDLLDNALITKREEAHIRDLMGLRSKPGGEVNE